MYKPSVYQCMSKNNKNISALPVQYSYMCMHLLLYNELGNPAIFFFFSLLKSQYFISKVYPHILFK